VFIGIGDFGNFKRLTLLHAVYLLTFTAKVNTPLGASVVKQTANIRTGYV
jgi:hypothetical protein